MNSFNARLSVLPLLSGLLVLNLMAGCISGFEKYYTPAASSSSPAIALPPPATPQMYAHSSDLNADGKRLREQGYVLLGTSSFYGPANRSNANQAVEQGKKVGAALVLVKSEYMDTLTGVVPYTVTGPPQTAIVNTTGTANAYGTGEYASGTYNSTSTVTMPGTTTTNFMPYSIPRNTFFASYWAKGDPTKMQLGAYWLPLPDEMRHRLQRNTGVQINIVVVGTPAFRANILEGDVIVKINSEDVVDVAGFRDQLTRYAGQTVNLGVIRGDASKAIPVTLNPHP
jgi:hypothetical protein